MRCRFKVHHARDVQAFSQRSRYTYRGHQWPWTTALEGWSEGHGVKYTAGLVWRTTRNPIRTLWAQRWVRALSERPRTAPAPDSARGVVFARAHAHADLGRENAVPPRLSLGWASPSRPRHRAPWEWGSRCRSPWSVCCSEQNSTCMQRTVSFTSKRHRSL